MILHWIKYEINIPLWLHMLFYSSSLMVNTPPYAEDRLCNRLVVNILSWSNSTIGHNGIIIVVALGGRRRLSSSLALAMSGRSAPSGMLIPSGHNRDGILVPTLRGTGKGGNHQGDGHNYRFTSLLLYCYHTVIRTQRREDNCGWRLQHRLRMNMNKIKKKGNNIARGVVMSHMPH